MERQMGRVWKIMGKILIRKEVKVDILILITYLYFLCWVPEFTSDSRVDFTYHL